MIKKRARKVVDAGMNIPLANLTEAIDTNEKLDALLSKDIVIPEEIEISLEGVEYIKGEKGDASEYPQEISISNLPEIQKVEVLNFPEQKAPVVNVEAPKAPIVKVDAPIVNVNNDEVVAELKNISEILSKPEGAEEESDEIEQVQIVDKDGKIVDFSKLGEVKVIGGGRSVSIALEEALLEKNKNYAILIDDVSTTSMTYIGKANIGSATSAAGWQIQRMDESGTPTTTVIKWANGNDGFSNVWNNRTSLTYI